MRPSISIAGELNGPPGVANGGYTCGTLAELLGGAVEVELRAPPPVDTELAVEEQEGAVRLLDGDSLVAVARPAEPGIDPIDPVGVEEARAASERGHAEWAGGHPFPTCVVCGPERGSGGGMHVFPGALDDGERFAAVWTPGRMEAREESSGAVAAPWVWAALDCPSSAPVTQVGGPEVPKGPCVLARMTARLEGDVVAGESYSIVAWLVGRDGRKHESASAIFSADGSLRGIARALWIELAR